MENNLLGWIGRYKVEVIRDGEIVSVYEFKNLITNNGLDLLRDALEGTVSDAEIKYIALGTDDGTLLPLAASNTKLGNEQFRKVITKQTKPSTGVLETTLTVTSEEGNFNIREIGVFAGSSASSSVNTGVLIARVFFTLNKTNLESVNIVRTDTIGRG